MTTSPPKNFRIRSFVRRDGRLTVAQERAKTALWPHFGLSLESGMLEYPQIFGRNAACYLEIGFGSGHSLLALAKAHPEHDYIGVETHNPGVGALFLGVQSDALTNIRVFDSDVVDVLERCIPDASLAGIQIFFPDPWPKRRHHERRLIQIEFTKLIVSKLKPGGILHLATDWEDYAKHMMIVLSQNENLINVAGTNQFAERSPQRPILTKFERRAVREGRVIRDLQFTTSA